MADSCAANGASTCSSGTSFRIMDNKVFSHIVVPFLCLAPLATLVLFPLVCRATSSFLAWYLRKKTDGRRCHIVELVEADEKKYREDKDDGGWERVGACATRIAKNGDKTDDDWDGIVGFFHPFW